MLLARLALRAIQWRLSLRRMFGGSHLDFKIRETRELVELPPVLFQYKRRLMLRRSLSTWAWSFPASIGTAGTKARPLMRVLATPGGMLTPVSLRTISPSSSARILMDCFQLRLPRRCLWVEPVRPILTYEFARSASVGLREVSLVDFVAKRNLYLSLLLVLGRCLPLELERRRRRAAAAMVLSCSVVLWLQLFFLQRDVNLVLSTALMESSR